MGPGVIVPHCPTPLGDASGGTKVGACVWYDQGKGFNYRSKQLLLGRGLFFEIRRRMEFPYSATNRGILGKVQLKDGSECHVPEAHAPSPRAIILAQLNAQLIRCRIEKISIARKPLPLKNLTIVTLKVK